MHPAPSIILFSTLSGLGFGLLAMLSLGLPAVSGWAAFFYFALGFALAVGGLVCSTFHLGHPERALKAFTQWRSSWLSREGWAAVAALLVTGLFALLVIFFDMRLPLLGVLGAVLSLATVFATSMIYTQLKTVPRWHHWSPPVLFMGYAISGGAVLAGQSTAAVIALVVVGALQAAAWLDQERHEAASATTTETATGLGTIGAVRAFEPPHTGSNYLTNEMVFRIGRKHATVLKAISLTLAVGMPAVILLLSSHPVAIAAAAAFHAAGVLTQRWLFFAEARHVVGLYYGR
ncbi:MAG: DmsC/YnfH family molybdoenzyme membrane anchor subunit [Pseudomonadota bacterium]